MNEKQILSVSFIEDSGKYKVDIPEGSTVPETVFAFAVVVKCLLRDGIIKSEDDIYTLLKRYLSDPQFEELKEEEDETNQQL